MRTGRLQVSSFERQVVTMAENAITEGHQAVRKAPPVSRTLRPLSGCGLLFLAAVNVNWLDWKAALILSGTFAGTFVFYALVHRLILQREVSWGMRKAITIAPLLAAALFTVTDIQLGVAAFYGVSLVVQALRGDRGCEVMTLPNLVLRRPVHCPCLIFSPLDRLEESIYQGIRGR